MTNSFISLLLYLRIFLCVLYLIFFLVGDISVKTIYVTLSKELNYTYKRVSRPKGTRFTQYNMLNTQAYIDFCQRKTARQFKFMDESGFKVTCGDRNYGHSKKGERCIEIGRNLASRNFTLNLLVGCDCVLYFNFVDGPSNTDTYLTFGMRRHYLRTTSDDQYFFPAMWSSLTIVPFTRIGPREY